MHHDPELEFYREQFRALIPKAVELIRRKIAGGSIQVAILLLSERRLPPHLAGMLPRAVEIVDHRLIAGASTQHAGSYNIRHKKATLSPAAMRLRDLGRTDLIERARFLLERPPTAH